MSSLSIIAIKQKKMHCGPCCIEMVLKFYGFKNIDQETIGKDILIKIKLGCYSNDVIRYLKRYNIIAEKSRNIGTLNKFKDQPMVIGTRDHFMLLVGKENDEKFILIDPFLGKRITKNKEYFRENVTDYIEIKGVINVEKS